MASNVPGKNQQGWQPGVEGKTRVPTAAPTPRGRIPASRTPDNGSQVSSVFDAYRSRSAGRSADAAAVVESAFGDCVTEFDDHDVHRNEVDGFDVCVQTSPLSPAGKAALGRDVRVRNGVRVSPQDGSVTVIMFREGVGVGPSATIQEVSASSVSSLVRDYLTQVTTPSFR